MFGDESQASVFKPGKWKNSKVPKTTRLQSKCEIKLQWKKKTLKKQLTSLILVNLTYLITPCVRCNTRPYIPELI